MIYLNEELKSYSISFVYNNQSINFESNKGIDIYMDIVNWLNKNGYKFSGDIHNNFIRKVLSLDEINEILKSNTSYKNRGLNGVFFKIEGTDKYMYKGGNIDKIYPNIIKYLINFGIDKSHIKSEGFDSSINTSKIKKFAEIDNEIDEEEMEDKIEIFSKNPFMQAICVLGGSGAGKSTTIENILDEEGHEFEFIIPSTSTTGLLSQFSPSKSGYVPSKLGKMILTAYENPTQLFTAVFDECHKSNVIEMINDELLQAISTKRHAGKRFISLDDDTAELYPGTEKHRGNILMSDNLGFIFISSKPDVIIHNDDFFNRIDIVQLKSYEEERLTNIEQLLSKTLSNEEKESLKSNND